MNATDSGLSEPAGFEIVVVCILALVFLSGCITGGCTVWLCLSKPRKGVGVDGSVMTNEVSRENPSSLEFVIFPAAGEKDHSQTCHHVLARAGTVSVSPGTVRYRGMRLIRPCEDCQPLRYSLDRGP